MDTAQVRQVLGLPADPTTGEVRIARRHFARRAHPDLHGGGGADMMADVNEACDRLIARVRRGERRTPVAPTPPVTSASHVVQQQSAELAFRPVYVVFTIGVMVAAALSTLLAVRSLDATAVAVALLVGATAGLALLIALVVLLRQGRHPLG